MFLRKKQCSASLTILWIVLSAVVRKGEAVLRGIAILAVFDGILPYSEIANEGTV